MVSNNEMVTLVREPHNKYDRNAIKVANTGAEQVGHIKREHAKVVSHLMDTDMARVEGIIPFGANNKFRMPVHIFVWGNPAKKPSTVKYLKDSGLHIDESNGEVVKSGAMGTGSSGSMDYSHVVTSRTIVTQEQMQNEMDKMFETLEEGDKTTEAAPCAAIASSMYPHQKQALNWMMCKENKDDLPPFWEQKGSRFLNILTMFQTYGRPRSVHGGILADDMGLGKTLETISLILTNFVDGKPLAYPVPGKNRNAFDSSKKGSGKFSKGQGSSIKRKKFGKSDPRLILSPKPGLSKSATVPTSVKPCNLESVSSDLIPSSHGMTSKEDPEYAPLSLTETFSTADASRSRSRRTVKRPSKYSLDDDSDDDDLCGVAQETPTKKRKNSEGKAEPVLTLEDDEDLSGASEHQVERSRGTGTKDNTKTEALVDSQPAGRSGPIIILDSDGELPDISPVVKTEVEEKKPVIERKNSEGKAEPVLTLEDDEDLPCVSEHQVERSRGTVTKDNTKTEALFDSQPAGRSGPIMILDSDDELPDISPVVKTEVEEKKPVIDANALPSGCDKNGRSWTAGPRGTLIVCPLSVVDNWVSQFEEHVDPRVHLHILVYHGTDRSRSISVLKDQDVVITTYATVTSDFKNIKSSPLFKIEWLRIVLDEGHIIRNPNAQQSKAIFELKAQRRWILTGTPIQNSMRDLWSLINFLRVQPFTDKTWWSRTIARPVARREKPALKRVSHLMQALAMRRLKTQMYNGKPLVDLPARHVYLEKITLSDEERQVYEAMQNHGQVIIGRYFKQGTLLHHYGEILAILMRLRQLCCHPRLVAKAVKKVMEENANAVLDNNFSSSSSLTASGPGQGVNEAERQRLIDVLLSVPCSGSDEECSICLDSLKQAVITACAHVYCRPCITSVIDAEKPNPKCPLCRDAISESKLVEVPEEARQEKQELETDECGEDEPWQSSAKIDALMKSLTDLRASDPSVKSVVVSQFTSLLTLIQIPLRAQGFSFLRLDGTMRAKERVRNVQEFSNMSPGSPTIFLLSLKAGGVGINLTAGTRIFLMDPAWNPAVEDQCFDRCHRLGQTKDVIITRFVIEDSVEERMLELQEKKRQLMQGAFDKKLSAEARRTNLVNMIKTLVNL